MRSDIQEIFKLTPHSKQVLMFSATLNKETRNICDKFMQDVIYKIINNKTKLNPLIIYFIAVRSSYRR